MPTIPPNRYCDSKAIVKPTWLFGSPALTGQLRTQATGLDSTGLSVPTLVLPPNLPPLAGRRTGDDPHHRTGSLPLWTRSQRRRVSTLLPQIQIHRHL